MSSKSVITHRLIRCALFLLIALPFAKASAQDSPLKPLTIDDYSKWRRIEDARISGNGQWVAYTLRHSNTLPHESKPELRIRDLRTGQDVVVPMAHDGEFSPDSRWIKYEIDSIPAPDRSDDDSTSADSSAAQSASPPRVELRELSTGRTQAWERMQSATFNTTSTHLLLQHRAASGGRGGSDVRGVDVLLHDLATRQSLFLGNVGDASFNRQGDLLAYAVDAEVRDGNGLFLMDLTDSRIQVLENDTLIYSRIEWSDDGDRLAALKGLPVKKMRERDNTLIAFADLRESLEDSESGTVTLDPSAKGFPEGFVISERASLSWSEDGRRVFFGIIPQTVAPDSGSRPSRDSVANVDVWRTQDERIQSQQMIQANRDRNFTFRQAFDAVNGRYVTLTDSAMRCRRRRSRWPLGRWARRAGVHRRHRRREGRSLPRQHRHWRAHVDDGGSTDRATRLWHQSRREALPVLGG